MDYKVINGKIAIQSYKRSIENMYIYDGVSESVNSKTRGNNPSIGIVAENSNSGDYFYYYPAYTVTEIKLSETFDLSINAKARFDADSGGWVNTNSGEYTSFYIVLPFDKTKNLIFDSGDIVTGIIVYDEGLSGTGYNLTVKDEGVLVNNNTNILDFVGTDIKAIKKSSNEVIISSPPLQTSDYFNRGTASVDDITVYSRYVSRPNSEGSPFKVGDFNLNNLHDCTNQTLLTYETNDFCLFNSDTTSFEVNIIDADNTSVLRTHTITGINGNVDITSNNIRIIIQNWQPEYTKFKAEVLVETNIGSILSNSGRFSVELIHHNNGIDYTKNQDDIFFDNEPFISNFNAPTIIENTPVFKYLSGIKYYGLNSTFTVNINNISYTNSNTYITDLMSIDGSDYGINSINLSNSDFNNYTDIWNNTGSDYQNSSYTIDQIDFRNNCSISKILVSLFDWSLVSTKDSTDENLLIDTYNSESDGLNEYFTDEDYRRDSNDLTFDSTQSLITYDSGVHGQIINGKFKVPNFNFSTCKPTGNPDYTGLSTNKHYYRRFTDIENKVRNSVSLNISGFTLSDLINEDIKLYIFIPSRFTSPCFVHGSITFDYGTFDGDNDPIRVGSSTTNRIDISFGSLGLTSLQNYFILHLIIEDSSIEIDSILASW